MRIRQDTLSQPAKEVLLFLGAKNPAILLDSSTPEIEKTVIRDGFLGAGQNCFSAAQVWVKRTHLSGFLGSFHDRCKAFKIGGPQEGAFMGPILESSVMDRYFKFIGISEREGAQVLMRGKAFTASVRGNYVTPTLVVFEGLSSDQMRKSVSLQTEILAPHLSVIVYEDEDHLIETLGRLTYGHTASVYGEEGQVKRIAPKLSFARVGLNRGMYDFGPEVTAQVFKRSGNHARLGVGLIEQVSRRQWIG
jgi:acyl-CoA reductase-like NAD-dependent aldehyde dehydrogenase